LIEWHTTDLAAPLTEEAVRKLRIDDSVSLNGTLVRHPRRDADSHVRPRAQDALRPHGPRGDPYRAEREKGAEERRGIRRATRRFASGTTTSAAWSAFTRR